MADTKRTCSIPDCGKPVNGRGWCNTHYRRWYRHGDPLATSRIVGDDYARFWSYVDKRGPAECWNWTGGTSPDGYGILCMARQTTYMPRYSWELLNGPMANGLEPDHLCRNRLCVNPAHLDPVTHKVNVLRGESPQAINARKTHCPQGHEYTPENTYRQKKGGRVCKTCNREDGRRRAARRRAERKQAA